MRTLSDSAAPGAAVDRRWRGRPPWRRGRTWLTVAAAAIAVAVAVTLVAVRNAPAGRSTSPPAAAPASGVPEYYVALPPVPELGFFSSAPDAVVGDTLTGKRVATVPAPKGLGFGGVVTAADDDRTFALGVQPRSGVPQPVVTRWYLLRLTPGAARPATLRQLPIPAQLVLQNYFSMALSPDGSMLAIATQTEPPVTELRVYSTATGALVHAWSAPSRELRGIETLSLVSWASGGHQLTFQTSAGTNGPVVVRLLPADDPGHDLLADSRPVVTFMTNSSPHNCVDSFVVSGNAKTVVCGSYAQAPGPASSAGGKACVAGTHLSNTSILQFSAVTGKLAGTLYQLGTSCQIPGDLALFWANDAGTAVLGYSGYSPEGEATEATVGQFGLFTRGKFTPLPAPLESYQGDPSITAW